MARIKNEDLIWLRPDIKFDGDYVAGSKLPALRKLPLRPAGINATATATALPRAITPVTEGATLITVRLPRKMNHHDAGDYFVVVNPGHGSGCIVSSAIAANDCV